ncbi:MAG: nitroreductase, partial [Thermodesulfobacteriota bacterium]|nr:nitroreductase [Thermodesulfobacteriota bacterium]
ELDQAIKQRYSVRSFKDKPVDKALVEEILTLAVRAPSWGNTQPWEIVAAGGGTVKALTQEFADLFRKGVQNNPDFTMPEKWPAVNMDRYRAVGITLFKAVGIARDDMEARQDHMANSFQAFSAPNLIYLILDQGLPTVYSVFDSGLVAAHICLLAASRGLGTCLLATSAMYPDSVRKHLNLGPEKKIVLGMGLGYPDIDAPANSFRSERDPLSRTVTWVDMD